MDSSGKTWTLLSTLALALLCSVTQAQDRPDLFGIGTASGGWTLLDPPGYEHAMWNAIRRANGHSTRIGASWPQIEPVRGAGYRWDELDAEVALCLQNGITPYCLIVNTPAWASPTGEQTHAWPPESQYAPDFQAFCTMLASRYADQISHWEFWNEQNGYGWHEFNRADEYVPWLRRAYNALKAGNPDCVVAIGGMDDPDIDPGDPTGWRGAYYMNLVYYYRDLWYPGEEVFDAIADHPYCRKDVSKDLPAKLRAIRDVLQAHGDGDKPLWLTEYGWSTSETGWTHAKQAQYLHDYLTVLTTNADCDTVAAAHYLAIGDFTTGREGFGLCDQNLRAKPAYYTFQSFPQSSAPQVSRVEWEPTNQNSVQISWETSIPSTTQVEYGSTDSYGDYTALDSAEVSDHTATITGLQPGEVYHFRVVSTAPSVPASCSPDYVFRCADSTVATAGFEVFGAGIAKWWTTWGRAACTDGALTGQVHSGDHSQVSVIIGNWGDSYYDFGEYSQVALPIGTKYTFSVWTRIEAGGATNYIRRIGTDPHGGTDPGSSDVIWSDTNPEEDTWQRISIAAAAMNSIVTVFVHGEVTPPAEDVYYWLYMDDAEIVIDASPIPGDFDRDLDVDQGDLDTFVNCASGPAVPLSPGCEDKDFDKDGDGDQSDFGIWQRCYSGEDNPGDPNCAN